jgi:ABC-2 type transport system ATP-binding protein
MHFGSTNPRQEELIKPRPLRPVVELGVDDLRKSYGANVAVADLSLSVGAGEVLGLLGPNGAGKTTTISCIAGLQRPDRGAISICGVDALRQGRGARRDFGLAAQTSALYAPLDAERNLRFYGALAGASGAELERGVKRAIERFQLRRLLGRPVSRLSVGEKRLVHVASAVVGRPRVVVLDEATANLDVGARHLVLEAVRELAAEGCAVLYSSHYLDEVEDLCRRVVILHRGAVITDGRVDELVGSHGGGRVELVIDGRMVVAETVDLRQALQSVGSVERLQSARVVRPSLEAVFIALTGEQIDRQGFSRSDTVAGGRQGCAGCS